MKTSGRILFICGIILFYFFVPDNTVAQDCTTVLTIKTNNAGSAIFINDKFSGTGNTEVELPKGKYFVQVKKNKTDWSSTYPGDSVFIDKCNERKSLFFSFKDNIFLSTIPPDVSVIYRDSLIGYTPLFVSGELHSVALNKNNYQPLELTFDGRDKLPVIRLEDTGRKNGQSFLKTNMFKILLGSALVLGTTAAYYKLKADDNFDLYNNTLNKAFLDKTDNYDLVSGIAFGALQVNFGILIYYFLTD